MVTKFVRHVCRAREHQQLPLFEASASWAPNTLTFYEGGWAYCPSGKPDGHDWEEAADESYEMLRERTERAIRGS